MTKDFTVRRIWTEHEGGTKFYQFFYVASTKDPNKAATVTHYASMTNASAKGEKRPVVGGKQTLLTKDGFLRKLNEKTKDGYVKKTETVYTCSRADLIACFGVQQFDRIIFEMFGTFTPDFTADEMPSEDVDTKDLMVAKAPDVRPANWGSW